MITLSKKSLNSHWTVRLRAFNNSDKEQIMRFLWRSTAYKNYCITLIDLFLFNAKKQNKTKKYNRHKKKKHYLINIILQN